MNGRRRDFAFGFKASQSASDQAARVQQVLRAEAALGPTAAIVEFHAQKIADLTEYTVFNLSSELPSRIRNVDGRAERNRTVYLQTCPRKRDIFQISHAVAGAAVLVLPVNVDQIRTEHSGFNTAIQHNLQVLSDNNRRSISAGTRKIALTPCKATPYPS